MYLKKSHFQSIVGDNATLTRLSSKAMQYNKDNERGIIYVNTPVYREFFDCIKLSSGGRQTKTTKRRINYGLKNHRVFQSNFQWYIDNKETKFFDGITIQK